MAEVIAEKGGEVAWDKAQKIWHKMAAHFSKDDEVLSASKLLANKPQDVKRAATLTDILIERFKESPELEREFANLLGGGESIQKVLASHNSWVERIVQEGSGTQIVEAKDSSVAIDIRQINR